jgi:glycosyltransferase involved in cell wall biosynthesis
MTAIFSLASVFLYPSRTTETWAEQFGYAAAEAMSAGVPVVTTQCGALPDVVNDAGIICPEDDAGALTDALIELLSDDERRQELGNYARERGVEQFSVGSVAKSHLSFARRFT